jgi:ribulose-5-phosphate 4-epimerase/fuculose-1-phosphate aldolase
MSAVLAPQPPNRLNVPAAEWALRVQLAGAYRIADHLGWSELIYTHISVRAGARGITSSSTRTGRGSTK